MHGRTTHSRTTHGAAMARRLGRAVLGRARTALVAATALLTIGGAAYAFMPAGLISGSGQVSTTADAVPLRLTVDKLAVDVISDGTAYLDVIAYNPSAVGVVLPADRLATPQLEVFKKVGAPGVCPKGSFTAGVPTNYTLTPVGPDDTAVVAQVPVTFVDLPIDQTGCVGATLLLTWPVQGI